MVETSAKGSSVELMCAAILIEQGFDISIPYGNNSRYDLIVDTGSHLYRLQCKKARETSSGNWEVRTTSLVRVGGKTKVRTYNQCDIDFFCTIIKGQLCLIDVHLCEGKTTITIHNDRVTNKKEVLLFDDCVVSNIVDGNDFKCVKMHKTDVEDRREWVKKNPQIVSQNEIPPRDVFLEAIESLSLAAVASKFHLKKSRVFEVAKQYGIELKHGLDVERVRKRGVYDNVSEKLKAYYREHIPKSSKPVIQMTKDGVRIAEFKSCVHASMELGIKDAQIRRVCQGKRKSYSGFIWRYKDDFNGISSNNKSPDLEVAPH